MQDMLLDEQKSKLIARLGERAGYLFSYLIFTTAVFYVRKFMGASGSWSYLHAAGITGSVAVAGIVLRRLLK